MVCVIALLLLAISQKARKITQVPTSDVLIVVNALIGLYKKAEAPAHPDPTFEPKAIYSTYCLAYFLDRSRSV